MLMFLNVLAMCRVLVWGIHPRLDTYHQKYVWHFAIVAKSRPLYFDCGVDGTKIRFVSRPIFSPEDTPFFPSKIRLFCDWDHPNKFQGWRSLVKSNINLNTCWPALSTCQQPSSSYVAGPVARSTTWTRSSSPPSLSSSNLPLFCSATIHRHPLRAERRGAAAGFTPTRGAMLAVQSLQGFCCWPRQ